VVEVIWTVVPIMILVIIAVPSFKILYDQERIPEQVDLTIKATGFQWYWGYEYPDQSVTFESRLVEEKDLKQGEPRLLTVDNPVVVPVNATVKVMITANDVVHAWTVPSFGVKKDAYPGRLNEVWFKAERVGTYYGQCSELCGTLHGYMPIMVKVVSPEDYAAWLADAKKKFADEDGARAPTRLAKSEPATKH
jgi:cytochrome c oxidase subunit 2